MDQKEFAIVRALAMTAVGFVGRHKEDEGSIGVVHQVRRLYNLHQEQGCYTDAAKLKAILDWWDAGASGMVKNRRLARVISDGAFGAFRVQMNYKTAMYGSVLRVADRFYPSSKTCSCCGFVKPKLALSQRIFVCENCASVKDRDKNAADNLENFAASFAVTACGAERSGTERKSRVKRAAKKQELKECTLLSDSA